MRKPVSQSAPLLRAHGVVSGLNVIIPGHAGPFGLFAFAAISAAPSVRTTCIYAGHRPVRRSWPCARRAGRSAAAVRAEIAAILDGVADGISAINKDGKRIYQYGPDAPAAL
jgi:hypothetical protein